jgi:hypothetical protein
VTSDPAADADSLGGGDGAPSFDAPPPPDAAVDARACVEGDDQVVDPMTGNCYMAFVGTRRTWLDAQAQCAAVAGQLAVITSGAENALIDGIANVEAWIGASDRTTEDTFEWADGTPFGPYTNWRMGEPNDSNGNEDCAIIEADTGGTWDDRPCDSTQTTPPAGTHYYICERGP